MRTRFPYLIAATLTLAAACAPVGEAGIPSSTGAGGGGSSGYSRCSNDASCGSLQACVSGTCVDRATGSAISSAVELRVASASGTATTEITVVPEGWALKAAATVAVGAEFATTGTGFPSKANVLFEVPALIPGRPALTFETSVPTTGTPEIIVPDAIRGRAGTLALIPLSPADQTNPPYWFPAVVPAGVNSFRNTAAPDFTLPKDDRTPHGLVLDSLMMPKSGYTARAYQNGTLVSNSGPTKDDGTFVLFVPAAVAGAVSIQLAPSSSDDPWFTFDDITLNGPNVDLGTVTLPAYQPPEQGKVAPVVFTVQADDPAGTPVAGAVLRAVTMMTSLSDNPGVTRFWRESTTDTSGTASPRLVPGANRTPRMYEVSVVPPAGSAYASKCVQQPPIAILNGGETATIRLALRPVLSGTVSSAAGTKLAGVSVVARRDPATAKVCSTGGPTTFTTTTDPSGAFALPVDAGTYQLDYDPPSGSAAPRLTEFGVVVDDNAHPVHPVQLPAPVLIEGTVVNDAIGAQPPKTLPNATIRIFAPRCPSAAGCTMPPLLRAETYSDANGRFRAVVAAPSSN